MNSKQRTAAVFVAGLLAFGLFSVAGSAMAQSSSATASGDATIKIAKGSASSNNAQFYVPSQLSVTKGTTVTWVNEDSTIHTVTSGDARVGTGDGLFDSSIINMENEFSHTFEAEGTFPYFCTLHPYMIGTVKVVAAGSEEASADAGGQGGASTGEQASAGAGSQADTNTGAQTSAEAKTMYKPAYPMAKANSTAVFLVQTDKHLYKPGEDVTVQGSIWADLLAQIGDTGVVMVEVADNNGTIITTQNADINAQGEYTTTFSLPEDAQLGAYTIDSKIEVDAGILETLSAELVARLDKPARFVVVSPEAFAVNAEGKNFDVNIASNSTSVTDFAFTQAEKKVSFKVEGETGTHGVAQVTLPKELLSGQLVVSIDGRAIAEDSNDVIVTSDTATEMTLEVNYPHSEHTIEITGTNVVPEFPVSMVVMAAAIGSIIAAVTVAGKRGLIGGPRI